MQPHIDEYKKKKKKKTNKQTNKQKKQKQKKNIGFHLNCPCNNPISKRKKKLEP